MATINTNNFEVPKEGYIAFDAMSLRQLIINRLNQQGIFTDQNYIGSNLASIIDIISYTYHTLIYYLNKTSSESMFSEAQLYENINRIVKILDYAPVGFQTSTLNFQCSAEQFLQGLYVIPRYSYVLTNNIPFSINEDLTFLKTQDIVSESINELAQEKLLYQGLYQEYPTYIAAGDDNEIVTLNTGDTLVDHFNIDVYVKPKLTGKWEQYTKTLNLFLENGFAKKYEIRLNPNSRYEIKFGNDINGSKLQPGDEIAIYYLASAGTQGVVGPNALNLDSTLIRKNSPRFLQILTDLSEERIQYLTNPELINLIFANSNSSTPIKEPESVDQIRQAAAANYRSQYRLVTTQDYTTFIQTNFANLIADVKTVNNWDYVAGYLKYHYDIGLVDPSKTERALLNQVLYADSCNFNNVYLLIVPRSSTNSLDYLVPAQKELINNSLLNSKMATTETVFLDPVYKAVSIGISSNLTEVNPLIEEDLCYLEIIKQASSRRNDQAIVKDIVNIFTKYFDRTNIRLGGSIDTRSLTQQILAVDGVQTFFTTRSDDTSIRSEGLSIFVWNPNYPGNDKTFTINNVSLKYFEYPFFNNINLLPNRIRVVTTPTINETIEY